MKRSGSGQCAVSDTEGKFSFDAVDMTRQKLGQTFRRGGLIVAKKQGFAPEWMETWGDSRAEPEFSNGLWGTSKNTPMDLQLARNDVPIRGQLIDVNNKPLAGARVRLTQVMVPRDRDLTAFLEHWSKANISETFLTGISYKRSLNSHFELLDVESELVTAADGRFEMTGVGRDRLVYLEITSPTSVTTYVNVMTREAENVGILLEGVDGKGKPTQTIYGANFTFTPQPGLTVSGFVRDRETKQPVAGMWVKHRGYDPFSSPDKAKDMAVTDAAGRFTITGLDPKLLTFSPEHRDISAIPQPGTQYVRSDSTIDSDAEMIIETVRGIHYRLKVVDGDGQPVEASVQYVPILPNDVNKDSFPAISSAINHAARRTDGIYEGFVVPGPGAILVSTPDRKYRSTFVDPKEFFAPGQKWDENSDHIYGTSDLLKGVATSGQMVGYRQRDYAAIVLVNPVKNAKSLQLSATLVHDTPRNISLIDSDGNPMSGVTARLHQWNGGSDLTIESIVSTFPVYGLATNRDQAITFVHAERKMVGYVTLRGAANAAQTVTLRPWATITGRFVDANGQPVLLDKRGQGFKVTDDDIVDSWSFRTTTDKGASFRLEQLIPGHSYSFHGVYLRTGELTPVEVFKNLGLQPGEVRDLGDIRVDANSNALAPIAPSMDNTVYLQLFESHVMAQGKIDSEQVIAAIKLVASQGAKDTEFRQRIMNEFDKACDSQNTSTRRQNLIAVMSLMLTEEASDRWRFELATNSDPRSQSAIAAVQNDPEFLYQKSEMIERLINRSRQVGSGDIDRIVMAIRNAHHPLGKAFLLEVLCNRKAGGDPFGWQWTNAMPPDSSKQWTDAMGGSWRDAKFHAAVGLAELGESIGVEWLIAAVQPNDFGMDGTVFQGMHQLEPTGSLRKNARLVLADLFGIAPTDDPSELKTWWADNKARFIPKQTILKGDKLITLDLSKKSSEQEIVRPTDNATNTELENAAVSNRRKGLVGQIAMAVALRDKTKEGSDEYNGLDYQREIQQWKLAKFDLENGVAGIDVLDAPEATPERIAELRELLRIRWGRSVDGVQIGIGRIDDRDRFAPSDKIPFQFYIRNSTKEPLVYSLRWCDAANMTASLRALASVTGESNLFLSPRSESPLLALTEVKLEPGTIQELPFGRFEMDTTGLHSGVYSIEANFPVVFPARDGEVATRIARPMASDYTYELLHRFQLTGEELLPEVAVADLPNPEAEISDMIWGTAVYGLQAGTRLRGEAVAPQKIQTPITGLQNSTGNQTWHIGETVKTEIWVRNISGQSITVRFHPSVGEEIRLLGAMESGLTDLSSRAIMRRSSVPIPLDRERTIEKTLKPGELFIAAQQDFEIQQLVDGRESLLELPEANRHWVPGVGDYAYSAYAGLGLTDSLSVRLHSGRIKMRIAETTEPKISTLGAPDMNDALSEITALIAGGKQGFGAIAL